MGRCCELCGQPLPERERRDPPLPPLEAPAIVTIHDLPPEARARAAVEMGPTKGAINGLPCTVRLLRVAAGNIAAGLHLEDQGNG